MRLCRFSLRSESGPGAIRAGYFFDDRVVPLAAAARFCAERTHEEHVLPETDDLLEFLPPEGRARDAARRVGAFLEKNLDPARAIAIEESKLRLWAPVPRPSKLLLLAGNYAAHIEEGGGVAVTRAKTFPWVFMKPPSTCINHPGAEVPIPAVSPDHIDWEVELGVVIGRRARGVSEEEALKYVAGYTVVNDISDRQFKPNPGRQMRERDDFFDWLHGKWHDGFCPMGPCVISAEAAPDPQKFHLTLKVNGALKQDATAALQIFPVAAVIAFISSFVTLEPGDIISTGTPSGVGNATGTYLKPGDRLEAAIDRIGILRSVMTAEKRA